MSSYINKIIYDGSTLIDLTEDTVTEESLVLGKTAHGADGKLIVGTLEVNEGGDTTAEDGLIEGTLTTYSNDRVTKIRNYGFYRYSSLTTANFPVATSIGSYVFQYCYLLTTVILRNTTRVCTLSNTNSFAYCHHYHGTVNATYNPDGLKDGYIYVPASLINSYKVATNWSTFATQFRALEDYTVDGTTTGELDENKI